MNLRRFLPMLSMALAAVLILTGVLMGSLQQSSLSSGDSNQPTVEVVREDKLIGICLPSQTDAWMDAGQLLKTQLENQGYQAVLAYGDGTGPGQQTLMQSLLKKPVHCLITAPTDSTTLPEAEALAKETGIPLLAYGALLMDTDAVSGYVCYDYFAIGASIGRYLEEKLSLSGPSRSYTAELFMGAPKDYNAMLFYNGLLSVLQSYFDTGSLECKSGRLSFEDNCISGWSGEAAAQACDARLRNYYPDTPPDILLCASDEIAAGVIKSLEKAEIQPDAWPLVTGNGATETGMANLESGKLSLTVRTDSADPAKACVAMVDRALFGLKPDIPMGEVFNNVISVPTALCPFSLVETP